MKKLSPAILLILPLLVVLSQQGCSQVSFSSFFNKGGPSSSATASTDRPDGNGDVYDGKLTILHHYVDQFTCEGRPQPESILIQTSSGWTIIQNTPEHCAEVDQAPVTGVTYDVLTKVAVYNDNKYIPPHAYIVDPSEDPNLPDIKPIDGVCEDVHFKCSLTAALTSAGLATYTADSSVIVSAGIYRLNAPVNLSVGINNHSAAILGQGAGSSILDGQNLTNILTLQGFSGQITIDGLQFQNGKMASTVLKGSAIENSSQATINLTNSLFQNNAGGAGVFNSEGNNSLFISKTQFVNNDSGPYGASLNFVLTFVSTIDQITITGDTGSGLQIVSSAGVTIKNSYFAGNASTGVNIHQCANCVMQNNTVVENGDYGIFLEQNNTSSDVFTIANNTIYHNSRATASPNFFFQPITSASSLKMTNSIIAAHDSTKVDCGFINVSSLDASSSIFDDATCAPTGTGNIFADPLLGAPALNGGSTFNMTPLTGSPAIDAGDNLTCAIEDQRSLARPVDKLGTGAKCDIGSIELR